MNRADAEYVARQWCNWPLWGFLFLAYYLPTLWFAWFGDSDVPLWFYVWGLLCSVGDLYLLLMPLLAREWLRKHGLAVPEEATWNRG